MFFARGVGSEQGRIGVDGEGRGKGRGQKVNVLLQSLFEPYGGISSHGRYVARGPNSYGLGGSFDQFQRFGLVATKTFL